nr:hypothetical protein [Neisseria meningitidis]
MPSEPEEADSTDYSGLTKIRTSGRSRSSTNEAADSTNTRKARQRRTGLNLIH